MKATSPLQLIKDGQSAARVGPGDAGYWQVGAMHYYAYEPGAVYDIYLSPKIGTALIFPSGEHIKVGLFLPKEEFDVEEKSAGEGQKGYDVITIHPKIEQGRYEAFALMANGRVYPLYLIVGKQGMFTVNFELPKTESQQ
jgi:type IV secretory pathway VirB9-like protein